MHVEVLTIACSEQKDDPDEVKLKAEMQQYGDIVRIDMVDTYADLSMKTLRMFSVLPQKIDADFYFKVDDDVAVNVDALADYLDARRTQGNLYLVSPPSLIVQLRFTVIAVVLWPIIQNCSMVGSLL